MPRVKSFVGLTLALCAAFAGCGASSDDNASAARWSCANNQDYTSCACERMPKDTTILGTGEVPACQDFSCCLYSPNQKTDWGTGSCECLAADNCTAEASSRPGVTVVPSCPPGATVPPVECAKRSENCRYDYLRGKGLEGCCTGNVCRESSDGVPLCQPATDEEAAFSAQCSMFARGTATQALELVTPTLETSVGTLTLPPVMYGFLTVGPLGCVSSLRLVLEGGSNCRFEIVASVAGRELAVTGISGNFSGCPGYTGATGVLNGVFSLTNPVGTLAFTGAACDSHLVIESYDVAGRFDFHLAGGESHGVTLADQHLVVEGGVGGSTPSGECVASE